MPSLQDIRRFNARLISLGNEPEVVRSWGEEMEDVPEPEQGLDTDLSDLLSDSGPLDDEPLPRTRPPDFSQLLAEEAEPSDEPTPGFDDAFDDAGAEPDDDVADFSFDDALDDVSDDAPAEPDDALDDAFGEPDDDFAFPDVDAGSVDVDAGSVDVDAGSVDDDAGSVDDDADDPFAGDDMSALIEGLGDELDAAVDEDEVDEGPEEGEAGGFDDAGFDDAGVEDADDADGFSFDDELFGAGDLDTADYSQDDAGDQGAADFGDVGDLDAGDFDAPGEPPGADAEVDDFGADGFSLPDEEFSFDLADDETGSGAEIEPALPDDGGVDAGEGFDDLGGFEFSDEEFAETSSPDDDFSFEEPAVPGAAPGASSAEDEPADLDEIGDDDLDEFSLGDFGAEFGVLEEAGPSEEDLNPAVNVPELVESAAAVPGDFQLNQTDFRQLQKSLAGLPLNLKLEVERVVSEAKGTKGEVEKLCRMLVDSRSPQEIATYTGRIVGKQIRIPRGYEKQTGREFEQDRDSFAYQFRENVLPIVRLAAILAGVVILLGVAGYNLVYRPLYARSLYQQGLDLVLNDQHSLGNQTFARAWSVWENPEWYYRYADAFVERRQYNLAREKYDELLFGRDSAGRAEANRWLAARQFLPVVTEFSPPRRGILAAARFESQIVGSYDRAELLLQLALATDVNDYDARLALGDNYLRWADEDPARFEDARVSYARLIERFGQTDELLFRMLRYFIRTDNMPRVIELRDAFEADPRARINAEIYAELAGYLIDNDRIDGVERILFRAMDVDNRIPELHYELARLYREIGAIGEERFALRTARDLLAAAEPLTPRRRAKLSDTYTRIGENEYASGQFITAQEQFTAAIALYEEGLRRRILGSDPVLARAYARLGDIFFYVGRDYESALSQFLLAEQNGYRTPDLHYKQGFIYYRFEQFDAAIDRFRRTAEDPAGLTNALIWATANTHYRRGSYFAAEAYYRELIDRVERERASIRTLLIDEDPRHRSVIEYMIRAYNNLGVTLQRLHTQTGRAMQYTDGLVFLTRSTELSENYRRDLATLARSPAVDLAFLNQREALFPRPEFEMQIYGQIPDDLDHLVF
ncbi:MAG: hypothetical protein EA382_15270 [Spirochaetaceae bacterium]|nr:MAG: hypothetical protein EA382_15270 [Spirochaetaceae bacterium]